jgi:hypothetical protein
VKIQVPTKRVVDHNIKVRVHRGAPWGPAQHHEGDEEVARYRHSGGVGGAVASRVNILEVEAPPRRERMECSCGPSKEQIRKWLAERWKTHAPLPDADHIRRQLGWNAAPDHRCTPKPINTPALPHGRRPR